MSYSSKSTRYNDIALLLVAFCFFTFFKTCLSSLDYGHTTTFRHSGERKSILQSIAKHRHHRYSDIDSNIRDIQQEENRFYDYRNISVHIKFRVAPDEFTSLNTLKDFAKLKSLGLQKNAVLELLIVSNHLGDNTHRYIAKVARNNHLLAKSFTKTYFKEDGSGDMIIESPNSKEREVNQCFYTGKVQSHKSIVSLNLCNGVHGIIEIDSAVFHLESERHDSHFLFQMIPQDSTDDDVVNLNCGTDDYSDGVPELHNRERRRVKGPPGMDKTTRFIEMYVVIDNALYIRAGRSVDAAVIRAINIVNYASGLYQQMNIYLAMIGVEVWNYDNLITLHDGISSDETLNEFLKYRSKTINEKKNNDNAQLFVGVKFANSTVGKGITTGICSNRWSGAVSADLKQNDYRVAATTMAHELGHNLGLSHDNSKAYEGRDCSCPQVPSGKCIMYSVSLSSQPKEFSQCSVDKVRDSFEMLDRGFCLLNIPEELTMSGSTPICGNYFVEEGEECDCGLPEDCKSSCCNPTTCKLTVNSTCANGMCCDSNTCNVKPKAHPCRTLQDNQCDLGEFCDGESPWCPEDTYVASGVPCSNSGDGFCYEGKCSTHNSQCAYLWGDNVLKSDEWCYVRNNDSNFYGHCGYDFYLNEKDEQQLKYKACSQPADRECGLLHCDTKKKVTQTGIQFAIHYNYGKDDVSCKSAIFDVGRDVFNPGMVPNGAKCGPNNMCIDHKCVEAPSVPDTCECHDRGKCNQYNECHCEAGWDPPFCVGRGDGGSVRSGPASDYDHTLVLKIGFGVFFGLGVPLVLAVLALIYWKRQRLRKILKRLGFMRSYTQPPLKTSPLHRLRPTQALTESNKSVDKGNISTPVFQSTTNNTAPFCEGTEIKRNRTPPPVPAPPKPKVTALTNHSNTPISAAALSKKVGPPRPRPPSVAKNSTESAMGVSSIADKVAMFSSKPIVQVIPSSQQESAAKLAEPTYENVSKSSGKPLPRPPIKPKPSLKPTNT